MASYRYHREAPQLDFFHTSEQYTAGVPSTQPPRLHDYLPVHADDPLTFAPGVSDIRGFAVNTPDGDTLGRVTALLADAAAELVAYAYVTLPESRMVVVPTWWLTLRPEQGIVIIEGGIPALSNAPEATFTADDAIRADRYWISYLRDQAA